MRYYKVYLAGPISGHSYNSVNDWRQEAKDYLWQFQICGYSPMRGKSYLSKEEMLADSYSDYTMSSINGINVRDYNDVKTSDVVLVNFLNCGDRVSIGTVMEIAWARAFQIPIVIVMEADNIHRHGMLTFGNVIVQSLDEGLDAACRIILP